ncbi:MAG: hypothetical protein AAGB31_12000 [Bdellovibrio sp.]
MSEKRQILDMLAQGKITVGEAESLLKACDESSVKMDASGTTASGTMPKFLHIQVDGQGENQEKVNIRVPIQLLKAGVKLAGFMSSDAKKAVNSALQNKGINLDLTAIKPNELDGLLMQLQNARIDVQSNKENVYIYCE